MDKFVVQFPWEFICDQDWICRDFNRCERPVASVVYSNAHFGLVFLLLYKEKGSPPMQNFQDV